MTTQDTTQQDKDLAVAREMLDAEIAALTKTLAERDALCEQQTRTIHGIPALMRERDAALAAKAEAESREHALGVQVVALQKRLALMDGVVDAARDMVNACESAALKCGVCGEIPYALAALDAVPGDALAAPVDYREASGVDVGRVSVAKKEGE